MKRLANFLISAAIIIISLSACCRTAEENPEPGEAGSMEIGGMTCIAGEGDPAAVGMFYEDGALAAAWLGQKYGVKCVYHTLVPSGLASELPKTETENVDLQYVIANAEALELDVSVLTVINNESDNPTEPNDILKDNAIRKCLENAHGDLGTYHSKQLVESSEYSPVTIQVFETKTVETYRVKVKQGLLKTGYTIADTAVTIMAETDLSPSAALGYVSDKIGFVNGVLPDDTTLEEYEGAVRYFRTSGYRGPDDSSFKMCPAVNEEYAVLYTILIHDAVDGTDVTDYMDVVSVAGEPEELYLNSPNAFTTSAIISNTYEYCARH